ncbi:MAG: FkbM family methyltransferase [Aphanothece sp. CMT-3BRIN-NPC111]|jgi:FkbM family methyltransferase|nr:FkbM family methyltransferase [Aphanothece sp. CMT-3BRIN-NPC111]
MKQRFTNLLYELGQAEKTRKFYRQVVKAMAFLNVHDSFSYTTYYNETQNDKWIAEYVFPGKRGGYFVEAGAANGREASSCYVLEKEFGWTGICVEPNDMFFEKLVQNRPNSICEKLCLSEHSGKVVYIEGDEHTVSPYLGGIKENLEKFKYKGTEVIQKGKEVEKDAITIESLLKKHNAPPVIDYGAFDIEGSELKVLEKFPFNEYQFLALSLECDRSISLEIRKLLLPYGYISVRNPFNKDKPWEQYFLHESIF